MGLVPLNIPLAPNSELPGPSLRTRDYLLFEGRPFIFSVFLIVLKSSCLLSCKS